MKAAVLAGVLGMGCAATVSSYPAPCTTQPDAATSGFVWLELPRAPGDENTRTCDLLSLPGGSLFACYGSGWRAVDEDGRLVVPSSVRIGSVPIDAPEVALTLQNEDVRTIGDAFVRIAPTRLALERWNPPRHDSWPALETTLPAAPIIAFDFAPADEGWDVWVLQEDGVLRHARFDDHGAVLEPFSDALGVSSLETATDGIQVRVMTLLALGDGAAAIGHYARSPFELWRVSVGEDADPPRPIVLPPQLADITPGGNGGGITAPRVPHMARVGPHALIGRDAQLFEVTHDGTLLPWALPDGVTLDGLRRPSLGLAPDGAVGLPTNPKGQPTPLVCRERVCRRLGFPTCDLPELGGRVPGLQMTSHLAADRWLLVLENGAAIVRESRGN